MKGIINYNKKKVKVYVLLCLVFCFFVLPEVISAAEGDIIWEQVEDFTNGESDWARGVAVDSSGIYICGFQGDPDNSLWRVEKRSIADGSLIWFKAEDLSIKGEQAGGIAVDSTGVYIVGMQAWKGLLPDSSWRVEKRSLIDGSLIWDQVIDFSASTDFATDIDIDSTGIYISGMENNQGRWRVEKRNLADGNLIWQKSLDLTAGRDAACSIAVNSIGVYSVGFQNLNLLRVEKRSLIDGSLIWERIEDLSAGTDILSGVTADSTGLYAVGNQNSGNYWRVEKRNLADGSLIWEQVDDFSANQDFAVGVVVDNSNLYISGCQDKDWRVEKRSLTDGSLIWERVEDLSGASDKPYYSDFYSDGFYTVGRQNGVHEWRVEKREKEPGYIDIGLRVYNGTEIVKIAGEPLGTLTSSLRIEKNGNIYGVVLVDPGDPNESGVRIQTSSGVKGLRKYP